MLARAASVLKVDCVVVGTARDGRTALQAAQALLPDVIVLDISMPGMSGLEVAECLRQAGCKAALVFLTVHDEEELIVAARAAGGIGYVMCRGLVPISSSRFEKRGPGGRSCRHTADSLIRVHSSAPFGSDARPQTIRRVLGVRHAGERKVLGEAVERLERTRSSRRRSSSSAWWRWPAATR